LINFLPHGLLIYFIKRSVSLLEQIALWQTERR